MKPIALFVCVILFHLGFLATVQGADKEGRGFYQYPAVHGKTLVFTAEGDLWTVSIKGGLARRLTTHPEVETRARFSPNGKTVAFSAAYEGPTEIYTMPISGGLPKRVTWEGYSGSRSPYPVGWKSDHELLYGTRYFARRDPFQIAVANTQTGHQKQIPLEQASDGVFEPTTGDFYFTRLPRQSSHAKRYKGGLIENLWRFRAGAKEAEPITADFDGTSRHPMLWKDRLYFVTDRDGCMNLWSMNLDAKDLKQHTKFKDWDLLRPYLHKGRIVFQRGADIWLYEIENEGGGKAKPISIRLASDFDQKRTRWIEDPLDYMSSYAISGDGKKVALACRGRAFVAPVKPGRLVKLPQDASVRFRDIDFLPETDQVYYLSDQTGEVEFWSQPSNGQSGKSKQITDDGKVLRYNAASSPDGNQIAYTDRDQFLWLLDVATGKSRKVTQSIEGSVFDDPDVSWSPDSRWLAFTDYGRNAVARIFLFDTKSKQEESQPIAITTDRLDSYSPAWSADGSWLYFLSDRTFRSVQSSPWGQRQPEAYLDKTTSVYALDLIGGERSPFTPDNELTEEPRKKDERTNDDQEESKSSKSSSNGDDKKEPKEEKEDEKKPTESIDLKLENLVGRLHRVPLDAGNYDQLFVAKEHIYLTSQPIGLDTKRSLLSFKITRDKDEQKTKVIAHDVSGYKLSADRSTILLKQSDHLYAFAADGQKPDLEKTRVKLSAIEVGVRPADEWKQLFVDAWRLHRDYFYDPNMHGVDWAAARKRHEALLPRISDRRELDDLIAMMVGELSAMHTNIYSGDVREESEEAFFGYLGAVTERAESKGGYRIKYIYKNDPDYPDQLAPVARPGIDISVGDVITAIDGVATLSVNDARELLLKKSGRQVLVETKRKGDPDTRRFIIKPLSNSDFRSLKLSDWEYTRRVATEKRSKGKVGYFHMRAMSTRNFAEFVKGYYPVFDRQGLIIDMRQNYGGNIDSWILGRLMRKSWMFWQARTGVPFANMQFAFNGHMVVLIDGYTISDGEAFSEGFRRLGLGPLIGTKTWGGGIWLRSNNRLLDGGLARSPEFGVFSPDRKWIIEGGGVLPDIKVDNPPHATFKGQDAQLQAAIKYLKKKIAEDPRKVPTAPKYPDKSE